MCEGEFQAFLSRFWAHFDPFRHVSGLPGLLQRHREAVSKKKAL